MGLDDLSPFNPNEKIIEYRISEKYGPLASMKIHEFSDELSSNSPAPGGGSVSALAGVLGASLSSMVANLTFGKKKWLSKYEKMCEISERSQKLKDELIQLIDKDTDTFNVLMEAYKLPQNTPKEIQQRDYAVDLAMKEATNIPFYTLVRCREIMNLALEAASIGNPNSISDAGVAGEMAHAGAHGAALNVLINLKEIQDKTFSNDLEEKTTLLLHETNELLVSIRDTVNEILKNE